MIFQETVLKAEINREADLVEAGKTAAAWKSDDVEKTPSKY